MTIRLRRSAVQRTGGCVGRKPLSRKSRASPAAGSLPASVRTDPKHDACAGHSAGNRLPGPHTFPLSPNGFELTGAGLTPDCSDDSRAAGVRCSEVLGAMCT